MQGKGELTGFIKLPFRLHEGTPWVPPLLMERRQFLDRSKNPFFGRAEVELLLAWRDGEPVGRISVQIDERWDEHQGGKDAQFGFIEARMTRRSSPLCSRPPRPGPAIGGASAWSGRWTSQPTTSAAC